MRALTHCFLPAFLTLLILVCGLTRCEKVGVDHKNSGDSSSQRDSETVSLGLHVERDKGIVADQLRVWIRNNGGAPVVLPTRLGEGRLPTLIAKPDGARILYVWEAQELDGYTTVRPDSEIGLVNLHPGEQIELPSRTVKDAAGGTYVVIFSAYQQTTRKGVWSGVIEARVNAK